MPSGGLDLDLPSIWVVAAGMSDPVPTCPHCGLPLSALQIAALVGALSARTRKGRRLAQHSIPYPHLVSPRTLVRLPKD
jgi:hypothetical protein